MIKKYYDQDCNLGVLDGKTVAIIGFGSQAEILYPERVRKACEDLCRQVLTIYQDKAKD